MSFKDFNKDIAEYSKQVEEMQTKQSDNKGEREFPEVPSGKYLVGIDRCEISEGKEGRPVLNIQWRILEGEFNKYCLFTRKYLAGTRNDNAVIYFATVLLNKFAPTKPIKFNGDFDELQADVKALEDEIKGKVQCDITYDKENYGQIDITDCWEC